MNMRVLSSRILALIAVVACCSQPASADQVILDDLIVDGSACIGLDCVNGESFGFDTVRLKENNLRIKFDDTSTSASFPNNDWQLLVNDSANGGLNRFSIEDVTGSKIPFTIEKAAPTNSLYVEDSGEIGFGTNQPVCELHVKDGDSPCLRLEQDGSSGFAPQTWDLAGNETNLFIRDATNGSKLPFRIRPNSDGNSIFVEAGEIGLFTASPDAALHLLRTSSQAQIHVEDNNENTQAQVLIEDTGTGANDSPGFILRSANTTPANTDWEFELDANGNFQINYAGSPGAELAITDNTAMNGSTINLNGNVNVAGALTKGSGSFKIDHPLDPANKFLYHSFVESPDMMNVYNGNAVLDENGQAVIEMPSYFEALNREFRYQLTAIGGAAPGLHIAQQISDNRFVIAGGKSGLQVSWQVTGVRKDPYAQRHPIKVEEDKPQHLRGYYLHPEAYGQPTTKAVSQAPEVLAGSD